MADSIDTPDEGSADDIVDSLAEVLEVVPARDHDPDEPLEPLGGIPYGDIVSGAAGFAAAAAVVVQAKIGARAQVRTAEIDAEARRVEAIEATRREELRQQGSQPAPEPPVAD
ncbi:hypothetical protein [Kitasatospora sp. NPDC015120]|uniref:hypothetical protein n=1 Tax=Kitasatospora sp. NPDC015120 TaxID=3364023 RepID=UPI0036F4559E